LVLHGAARRLGFLRPEAARGEPDDVGVDRDLDDGMAGPVVWPAGAGGEHAGQGLLPGAGGELVQALPLARDPGAAAEGVVDGAGGLADGSVHVPPVVLVHQGEVAALRVEDLGELADVELACVAAGGWADPEPVAAADGLVRRQVAGDRLGDAAAGGAAAAGRAQHLVESLNVAQVDAGVGPAEPGDPGQRLGRGGRQPLLLVLLPAAGAVDGDRGGVVESIGELAELQVVSLGEPADIAEVVLAGDRDDGARQRAQRQSGGGPSGTTERSLAVAGRRVRRYRQPPFGCACRPGARSNLVTD
jgi:hypothetical protein